MVGGRNKIVQVVKGKVLKRACWNLRLEKTIAILRTKG